MNEKVYVFIDASNIWQAQKVKGKTLDYLKLQNYINATYNCVSKIFYYTAYPKEGTRNYSLEGKYKFYVFLKRI